MDISPIDSIAEHLSELAITTVGKKCLRNTIHNYQANPDMLGKRHKALGQLANNPEKIDVLETYLTTLHKYEEHIDNWSYSYEHENYMVDKVENAYIINVLNYGKIGEGFILLLVYVIIYYAAIKVGKPISIGSYVSQMVENVMELVRMLLTAFSPIGGIWILYASYIVGAVYSVYQLYLFGNNFYQSYKHYKRSCEYVEKYYSPLQEFMNTIEKLMDLDIYTGKVQQYRQVLTNIRETYPSNATFGEVVLCRHNYDGCFDDLLRYVGEVDSFVTCVQLLKHGYVLPRWKFDSTKPVLRIRNMWHPELGFASEQQRNSVDFSGQSLQILTAPNKSGKSTYMKTALVNVWLAHTLGICPAARITLTPFVYTFWYLNIPDTLGRESLFEAELERCYKIYKKIRANASQQFFFGIIDELFTGTNPIEGAASTYAIAKMFADSRNSLFILSTHFSSVAKVAGADCKHFLAMHNGKKYTFDYIVRNGISQQHIALDLLREIGFDKDIVDCAVAECCA